MTDAIAGLRLPGLDSTAALLDAFVGTASTALPMVCRDITATRACGRDHLTKIIFDTARGRHHGRP